jgi:UDP-glucose 4-epimerase
MRICITGVAGFIGSNLAMALVERGYEVTGIDNLSQGFLRNIEPLNGNSSFRFVKGDVRDATQVLSAAKGADIIVHLAAYKIPRYDNALDTLLINAHGAENVLKAGVKNQCRVLFASTSDVYGKNPHLPFSEETDLYLGATNIKRWAYACSKLFDEHLAFAYAQEFGLCVVGIRFFGAYGPRQNLTWWGGPQSVFINAALKNEPMEIHGDGKQTRSFTYIDDTVDGVIKIIEKREADGQIFNLGDTEPVSIIDLASMVWKLVRDDEPKLKYISYQTFGKYDDVRNRVPDITKAREILGFEPKVGLMEGLTKTVVWQRSVLEALKNE